MKIVSGLMVAAAMIGMTTPAISSVGATTATAAVAPAALVANRNDSDVTKGYWTASSEYSVSTSDGHSFVRSDGRKLRRVMISGYHPVEGFSSELVAEAAAAARWDARSTH